MRRRINKTEIPEVKTEIPEVVTFTRSGDVKYGNSTLYLTLRDPKIGVTRMFFKEIPMKISEQPEMQKYVSAIRNEVQVVSYGFDDPNYPDSRVLGEFYLFLAGLIQVAGFDTQIAVDEHKLLLRYRSMVHSQKLKAMSVEFKARMGEVA